MSADAGNRVVIRRRRRHQPDASHSGSWKIAYADFMTAMMAFFLVMWLVGITSQGDREGIAEFFRMPLRVAMTGGDRTSTSTSAIPGGGADVTRAEGEVRRADPSLSSVRQGEERRDAMRLENLRERLENLIERNPVLRQYQPQLLIDITSEGLRIQIVDDQSRPMFPNGSARVEPHMRAILREIGPTLNDLPNKISLSGHTDATLYSSGERAYSNWELSADRANASRRELIAGGMDDQKVLRIIGLASTMPLVRDDPHAAINRRISLVVLNLATQRRIERENMSAADSRSLQEELQILRAPSEPSGAALTSAVPETAIAPAQTPLLP